MAPEFDRMAVFVQVVESGSFTAAAQALGLPKSTVSQQVARLEASLGVRLLQRSTRKLSLTAAGQLYVGHCQRMVEAGRAADAAVSRLRAAPAGQLRLTAPEASGVLLFAGLVPAFRRRYPLISVDMLVTDAHLDLIGERIDLAFRTGRLADSSFVSRHVGEVRRALVAAPDYVAHAGLPVSPADLADHACLVHHPAPDWPLTGADGLQRVVPPPGMRSSSLMYLQQAAVHGAGIAMLPAFMCRRELAGGQLVELLAAYPPLPNQYFAVYPTRTHVSAALRAFLDFVGTWGLAERLAAADK